MVTKADVRVWQASITPRPKQMLGMPRTETTFTREENNRAGARLAYLTKRKITKVKKQQLTEEQRAARDARKARFAQMVRQVAEMNDEQKAALVAKMGQLVNCEGQVYSVRNTLLIAMQCPTATIVGGFRQWLKQGRCVRKGEHGASILFPRTFGDKDNPEPTPAEVEARKITFLSGTVFDIAQTEVIEEEVAA